MTRPGDEIATLSFEYVKVSTDDAWLVVFDEETEDEAWLPKSRCDLDIETKKVQAPAWLVEEKEIEAYVD